MKLRLISVALILLSFCVTALPQETDGDAGAGSPDVAAEGKDKKEKAGMEEERKAIALLLVKDSAREIESLQSLTNRIGFSSSLADISYDLDKEMSRRTYMVLADSISRYMQNASAQFPSDEELASSLFSFSSKRFSGLIKVASVRSQAVLSAATHDPVLALDVLELTSLPQNIRKQAGYLSDDQTLLLQMVSKVKLDNDESIEMFGTRLLKKGLNSSAVALLARISAENPDLTRKYGAEVLSSASREIDRVKPDLNAVSDLLRLATQMSLKPRTGAALLDPAELRYIAEGLGRAVLAGSGDDGEGGYYFASFATSIKKFAPEVADRIVRKFKITDDLLRSMEGSMAADLVDTAAKVKAKGDGTADKRADEFKKRLNSPDAAARAAAIREFIDNGLEKIGTVENPELKTSMYILLANRLEQLGAKEQASEMMDQAFKTTTTNPVNYQEFLQVWALAGAIVDTDPERAFSMVEDLVFRLNDVIANFHRVAEFMDPEGQIIESGELQFNGIVGGMGGRMLSMVNASGNVVKKLAEKDLARTRAIAERFDRPEVRVAANMMILKSYVAKSDESDRADDGIFMIEGEN